jgi:glycosyltransferase involved in cell wall biosynthesis
VLERQVEALRHRLDENKSWRAKFRPTLFTLDQYPPREWKVPGHYFSVKLPANPPSIAIVTPSLNQGEYIERTISSVLSQQYPALHYTVQDGSSSDETHALLRKYENRLSWVSEHDKGQAHAINLGFSRAKGDLMGWLNSDDLLLPGTLAYVARFFSDHPDVDVVYGHRICIDRFDKEIGRIILPRHDPQVIRWVDFIPQETMFWRRRVWDRLGGLDESLNFALDWDFILRAHAARFRFCRLPRFLGGFRVHDAQKTISRRDVGDAESARLRERYLGRPVKPKDISMAITSYLRRHVLTVRAYKLRLVQY